MGPVKKWPRWIEGLPAGLAVTGDPGGPGVQIVLGDPIDVDVRR
jgi:hypothetical protein